MSRSDVGLRSERGPVLLAVMVATGLVAIDTTILATAVPTIVGELGGFSSFPWLFSIYLLAQTVTVPVYAKLADTIGRKPVILFGIAVFLLGSILCGAAWDMTSLIAFRGVQGIGAGAILPITITIIGDIYSVAERARVQGYTASVWAISAVAGPTLGGAFAQIDMWRLIFFINIPLCLLAAWMLVRNLHERVAKRAHRIDYAGAVLLTASLTLLILGILEGGNAWAWNSPTSIGIFMAGAVLLIAFVLVERRAAEPVLALWVLTRRLLLTTSLVSLVVGASLIGLTAFIPTYLENGLGVDPIVAGLALATLTIGWPIASGLSGRFYLRIGFRATTIIGAVVVLAGTVLLALLASSPSIPMVAVTCFVIGFGFGLSTVPSLVAAQASVEWAERGVVTGANLFARSMGQALGVAVLGAIANAAIAARGGDETDPGVIIPASVAVLVAVAGFAVILIVSALAMPRTPRPVSAPEPALGPETGPVATSGT